MRAAYLSVCQASRLRFRCLAPDLRRAGRLEKRHSGGGATRTQKPVLHVDRFFTCPPSTPHPVADVLTLELM
eukprot:1880595-Prymnesium_polylepis.1